MSGAVFASSVLILPDRTSDWPARAMDEVTAESLAPITAARDVVDLLLLGTGRRMLAVPPALRAALRQAGIVLEAMDTGAAARTFNVLVAEDRRVAAALLRLE